MMESEDRLSQDPAAETALHPQNQPEEPGAPLNEAKRMIFEGRLHPLTLVFSLVKGVRRLVPLIPIVVFGGRGYGMGAIIFGSVITVISTLVRYFSFGFRIEGGDLLIEEGILARRHRSIPLERVQEIRIEQGVLHRLFDVVDATVETGGGGGAEATLSVLSRAESDRLRQAVADGARAARLKTPPGEDDAASPVATAVPEETVLRTLRLKDLVVAGLTSNHLLSAVALAGVFWNLADDIVPDSIYQWIANWFVNNFSRYAHRNLASVLTLAAAAIAAIFVIGAIFSIIGTILLFYGFTFSRRGDDLRRRYGLLTRRSSSLPRRRIQVLEIEEKFLRRLVGLATLRADTSGGKREGEDDNDGRDVLIPVARREEIDALLPAILPEYELDGGEWRQVSRLAVRRGVIEGAILCLGASALFFAFNRGPFSFWPLALLPLVWWLNVKSYRRLGYALGDRYFRTRRGWLGRSTHITPINKIQAVVLKQSPFDRRLGLASISVDTAGQAYTEGGPRIENLPLEEARALARTLAQRAAVTRFQW
jgi:putative membrane protein